MRWDDLENEQITSVGLLRFGESGDLIDEQLMLRMKKLQRSGQRNIFFTEIEADVALIWSRDEG